MYNFKNIKFDNTLVTGLTNETDCLYLNFIFNSNEENILVVTNSTYEANKLFSSLTNYLANVYLFLMDDFVASESDIISPEFEINRLETLNGIVSNKQKKIIVTNLMGFLRILPTKDKFENSVVRLRKNEEIDKDKLYRKFCSIGYKTESLVTKTGEVSNRGYVIDIFPISSDYSVRLEFWGDTIESIKYFDVDTQLSVEEIDEIVINPSSEFIIDDDVDDKYKKQKYLCNYVKTSMISEYLDNPIIVYKDYNQIYNSYLLLNDDIVEFQKNEDCNVKYVNDLTSIFNKKNIYISTVVDEISNIEIDEIINYNCHNVENYNDNLEMFSIDIRKFINEGKFVVICMPTESKINNLVNILKIKYVITNFDNLKQGVINFVIARINDGYSIDNLVVFSESNIFKNIQLRTAYKSKFKTGTKISNINSLQIGDYVVHNSHGIGKYVGIVALKNKGIIKDYLQLEYGGDDKLYIPVEKIELIHKYSMSDGLPPKLNKLGGTEWTKTKLRVRGKLENVAKDLIRVAAERKMRQGFAFEKDTPEEEIFANEFEYDLTPDQSKTIAKIKGEMQSAHPMDMLLCGDVGYGKTEVAFRAIFKAICSGKQVAYLCPTTILSNQQYTNALNRFRNYPINIGLMNRFTSNKNQKEILQKLKAGNIDILIGTHRILSDDVSFKDLGFLIVDEEQRFGVSHKEKIKKFKSSIDVLTLSATPIPRTLQMSLLGIRDLALIETPPLNRYPVQTYVIEENDYIIRDAVYKELARNGQVFILCNRIEMFSKLEEKLTKLIPDAKLGFAHGKMDKTEIEDTMIKFINGEFNILICTTIIETGIDIQNANTLIIFDADKLGLSQLYQIRGRVGRSDRVAYAYLMYQKSKVLSEVATKRLQAMKEFASLGSGFKIAMRDLAIRGAGDVLGLEQSGFIDQIGIDLYMKLLNEEIDKIKGNNVDSLEKEEEVSLNVSTHIDDKYVSDDNLKIEIHKLINEIDSKEKLEQIKYEIEDRFGKISDDMLVYMYEELFESLKNKKKIEKTIQNEKFIKLIFEKNFEKYVNLDELFINSYKVSKNFKISKEFNRITLTLNLNNLDKHWIYYVIDILDFINL